MARNFARYLAAGTAAALAQLLTLILLREAFGIDVVFGSAAGFVVAIGVNFSLLFFFVFRRQDRIGATFAKYLLVTLIGLTLNSALMSWLTTHTQIHYVACQIAVTGAIFVANFLINRALVFR